MKSHGSSGVAAWALVAAGLLPFAAGCGESSSGNFKTYGDLENSGRQPILGNAKSKDDTVAKSDSQDGTDLPKAQVGEGTDDWQPAVAVIPTADSVGVTDTLPGTGNPKTADVPLIPEVLIKDKKFKTEGPGGAIRVTYDDIDLLKVINMDPVAPTATALMPKWLKDLDGKRVRLRGFMYPPFEQTGIEAFGFARDNQICCFGKNPKIYDLFPVTLRQGVTTYYILNRPFDVVGVFHISPAVDEDGELLRLYAIDDAVVIEK